MALICLCLGGAFASGGADLKIVSSEPGNVFFAGQTVRLRVVGAEGRTEALRVTLTDYEGHSVPTSAMDAKGGLNLGRLPRGYYELTVSDDSRQVVAPVVVVPKPRLRRDSRLATDAAHSWLIPPERFEEGAELLRRAGFAWARERISWPEVEPERGNYKWGKYDASAEAAHRRGIQVYQVFHNTPAWARADRAGNRYPDDLRDVYNFCRAAAEHFKGRVQAWEVWNEADITAFSADTGSEYAAFLKAAYLGFKAGDPHVQVTQVSLAGASPRFHECLYKNGTPAYFDIFNYHIYDAPKNYPRRAEGHFALMTRYGLPRVPVWLTEAGIPLRAVNDTLTPAYKRRQAEFIPKSYVMSLASGTDRHFFFVFPHYIENGVEFGALDADLKPYPGYATLAAVVDMLGEARYRGRVPVTDTPGLEARLFDNGAGETLVLWTDGEARRIALPILPTAEAQVFDCVGARKQPEGGETLALTVSPSPLYVRLPRGPFWAYGIPFALPPSPGGPVLNLLTRAGFSKHGVTLTPEQLIDPAFFNAKRFPVALYADGEDYAHTVRSPGDAAEALARYVKEGGTLLLLASQPWPMYYATGPRVPSRRAADRPSGPPALHGHRDRAERPADGGDSPESGRPVRCTCPLPLSVRRPAPPQHRPEPPSERRDPFGRLRAGSIARSTRCAARAGKTTATRRGWWNWAAGRGAFSTSRISSCAIKSTARLSRRRSSAFW